DDGSVVNEEARAHVDLWREFETEHRTVLHGSDHWLEFVLGEPGYFIRTQSSPPQRNIVDHSPHYVSSPRQVSDEQIRPGVATNFCARLIAFAVQLPVDVDPSAYFRGHGAVENGNHMVPLPHHELGLGLDAIRI